MTVAAPAKRPTVASRRFGYGAAVVANAAILYLVNVWPGWDVVPFLSREMPQVLGWVNASIIAGIVVNLAYIAYDARWFRAVGDLTTTLIGLVAIVRVWQVFPFSFDGNGFDWAELFRFLLVVAAVGSVVGIVVQLVTLVRVLSGPKEA